MGAEIQSLVESTKPGKSYEELLAAHDGREDDLIKNLKMMQTKQAKGAQRAEVKSLVESIDTVKSGEEMLDAYEGKEDELIKNLEKMKTKQSKKAERKMLLVKRESVKALVAEVKPGKSVDDLMTTYEGKEDDL